MSFTRLLFDDPLHTREWYMRLFIEVANELGIEEKPACVLAAMCCFQEAGVQDGDPPHERRIWCPANPTKEPSSVNFDHDSESDDGRSCGICQQQRGPHDEEWWGSVADEMNPRTAIRSFMSRLPKGFHANDAVAANNFVQAVQRSGVPDGYARWWGDAVRLYNEVKAGVPPTVPVPPEHVEYEHGPWTGDPTWLADVLRAEGLTVVERQVDYGGDVGVVTWRERGHGDMGSLWGVVCHHTGSNNTPWTEIWNGRPDLAGPLANIFLRRDGVVEIIAVGACWHGGTGYWPGLGRHNANQRCLGIEAQNDGGGSPGKPHRSSWPDAQYDAYVRVCAAFCRRIDVDASHVISHQEYDSGDPPTAEGKWDPGAIDMNIFRADVQARIDSFSPVGEDDPLANPEIEKMVREIHACLFNTIVSRSLYRDPQNPDGSEPDINTWQLHELIKNDDGMIHQKSVEADAAKGDPDAIFRIVRVADGQGAVTEPWAIEYATRQLESLPKGVLAAWNEKQNRA